MGGDGSTIKSSSKNNYFKYSFSYNGLRLKRYKKVRKSFVVHFFKLYKQIYRFRFVSYISSYPFQFLTPVPLPISVKVCHIKHVYVGSILNANCDLK